MESREQTEKLSNKESSRNVIMESMEYGDLDNEKWRPGKKTKTIYM